ncbi:DUF6883 domain-containing protein [Rhodoferax sp.]|uniref:DUF6883 domain-containing protein n=1 Tax=Rhodoferax sp. TaxID=50421 RepID=UPI00275FFBAD|nr:hypothetical protein [Rhodoferax sp.]
MPPLPADRRIDRSKIDDYLLHPVKGRGKAAFFQAYGFAPERWHELRDALLAQAAAGAVLEVVVSPYGNRYIVRGTLGTPSRREPQPMVCTVWQADTGVEGVRLITAYPD